MVQNPTPTESKETDLVKAALERKAELDTKIAEMQKAILRDPFLDIGAEGNKKNAEHDRIIARELFGNTNFRSDKGTITEAPKLSQGAMDGFDPKQPSDKRLITPQTDKKVETVNINFIRTSNRKGSNDYEIEKFKAEYSKDGKKVIEITFSGNVNSLGVATEITTFLKSGAKLSTINFSNGKPASQSIFSTGDDLQVTFSGDTVAETTYTEKGKKATVKTSDGTTEYSFKFPDPRDPQTDPKLKKQLDAKLKVAADGTQVISIMDGKTEIEKATITPEKKPEEKGKDGEKKTGMLDNTALRNELAAVLGSLNLGKTGAEGYSNTGGSNNKDPNQLG